MTTVPPNFLSKDIPVPIAMLDTKLNFISYSNQWLWNFTSNKKDITGKNFFEVVKNIPKQFSKAIEFCLEGNPDINEGQQFILPNGKSKWLKWKISPHKNSEGVQEGILIFLEDITEDKRELELLHKAESVARIGGWEVDLLNNTVYWTKTTKEIHEVDDDFVPNLEEGINFYKKGYHRDKITKLVSAAIEKGKPWDTELLIITAKGNEVWVRAKGEVEMVNNMATRIIGTFQDIDIMKKADLQHQKLSARFKAATLSTKVGIWEYDIKGNEIIWDENMYTLYGIKEKDFSGAYQAWKTAVHPEDQERGNIEIQKAIIGEKKFDTEFRVVLPDGQVKHVRAIAETIKDNESNTVKLIGANWDITDLKVTRLKLEKTEEFFQETFENSATGMALVSLEGTWIKVNNSLSRSLGYTSDELIGKSFRDLTHPEDLKKDFELLQEVINGKRESYELEKRYFHKNGNLIFVLLTVTVVKKVNGEISHLVSQELDITERIEGQKKLNTLVDVTKSQNDSLMNFAHIVSHNLRSHSTNLTMLTKILSKEKDEQERENINAMIYDAAESLSETISHLNDVVQVKTGALENLCSINVLNTIKQIERSIGGLIDEQKATIEISIPKTHFVNVVPAYFESITLNLLTNALKYRSPDRKPIIRITSISKNNSILVKFSDNGQGIDLERHGDKIFGMYKTFHKHKDAKGIGLFITKNQIEAMNGSIRIESEVDLGTTILIELQKG